MYLSVGCVHVFEAVSGLVCTPFRLSPCDLVAAVRHMCMAMRGVQKPGAMTITSCFLGSFKSDSQQSLFFSHIRR